MGPPHVDLYTSYKELNGLQLNLLLRMSKKVAIMIPICWVLFLHLSIHGGLSNSSVGMENGEWQGHLFERVV